MNEEKELDNNAYRTVRVAPSSVPPPLPVARTAVRPPLEPLGADTSFLAVADAVLKCPGRILYEMLHCNHEVRIRLLCLVLACSAAYGLTMGSFSGGMQLWAVPLKSACVVLFSALLCLPSLYILIALGGGDRNLTQVAGILLQSLALAGLLLLGFAPIAWIFAQSTSSIGFMGAMHLAFWGASLAVGLRLMFRAVDDRRSGQATGLLVVWCIVFCAVLLQMATVFRPLLGPADCVMESGKKFFMVNLVETMDEKPPRRR